MRKSGTEAETTAGYQTKRTLARIVKRLGVAMKKGSATMENPQWAQNLGFRSHFHVLILFPNFGNGFFESWHIGAPRDREINFTIVRLHLLGPICSHSIVK